MQASKVGGDNVGGAGSAHNVRRCAAAPGPSGALMDCGPLHLTCARRTSSTLLLDQDVADEQPWLAAPIVPFQEAARQLTGAACGS